MAKERFEAESIEELVEVALPAEAKEVYAKPIDIANAEYKGVSIRALDRTGNKQYQLNAFQKVGTAGFFCGKVNESPMPKDPKKLTKALRDYNTLGDEGSDSSE